MVSEVYADSQVMQVGLLSNVDEAVITELKQGERLAHRMGMPNMASVDEVTLLKDFRLTYVQRLRLKPMSSEEWKIWTEWLPTSYRSDGNIYGQARHEWRNYSFDRIPLRVRELIVHCQEQKVFEWLEIRTQEYKYKNDPALFGWLDGKTYLLARWGESDGKMLSFEDIKEGLKARKTYDMTYFYQFCLAACTISGLVIATIVAFVSNALPQVLFCSIVFIILCIVGIYWFNESRRQIKTKFAYALLH